MSEELDSIDETTAVSVTRAARKLLAWAPDGPLTVSADRVTVPDEELDLRLPPELARQLQAQADARGLPLETYLAEGLTRVMAGAAHLGQATGREAVTTFLDLVAAERTPTTN